MSNSVESSTPKKSLLRLWPIAAMFLVFAVPLSASYYAYVTGDISWLGASKGNKGKLVAPNTSVADLMTGESSVDTKWHVVNIEGASCDAACEDRIWAVRQARIALGDEANQLTRWLVLDQSSEMNQAFEKVVGEVQHTTNAADWLARLAVHDIENGSLVLVDSHKNAVLVYPANTSAQLILKDMNRLIKGKRS